MNKKEKLIVKILKDDLKSINKLLFEQEKELNKIKTKGFDKEIHKDNRESILTGLSHTIGYCTCHKTLTEKIIFYLEKKSHKDIQKLIDEDKKISNLNKKELKRVFSEVKLKVNKKRK